MASSDEFALVVRVGRSNMTYCRYPHDLWFFGPTFTIERTSKPPPQSDRFEPSTTER
jgi:hypothetical protein